MEARLRKDKGLTLILEILPGLFGFLGIGWIYAGETTKGIIWLVSFLVWHLLIVLPVSLLTAGIGLCVTIPIDLAVIAISATTLNSHVKQHPEIFG